jgi:hypothetical protein
MKLMRHWQKLINNIKFTAMKKTLLALSISGLLLFSGNMFVNGQDEPKPKKDTVNMDTNAKPETYYEIEDDKASGSEKGSTATIAIICGVVVVAAGIGFFLLKKKK